MTAPQAQHGHPPSLSSGLPLSYHRFSSQEQGEKVQAKSTNTRELGFDVAGGLHFERTGSSSGMEHNIKEEAELHFMAFFTRLHFKIINKSKHSRTQQICPLGGSAIMSKTFALFNGIPQTPGAGWSLPQGVRGRGRPP